MKKVILTILDGLGLREEYQGNAFLQANCQNILKIWNHYPTTSLSASGLDVGLPDGQMGNSEVGHMNIGAGRIVYQDLTRINKDIESKKFFKNQTLIDTLLYAKENSKKLHLLGLLSDGGVHSHINHLFALLELCQQLEIKDVFIHVILDGRDTNPTGGEKYLKALQNKLNNIKIGKIATITGRFYTMDRDNRYERIKVSYEAMTKGLGNVTSDYLTLLKEFYQKGITDEFVEPIIVTKDGLIEKEDAIIFYNYRPDRAREITKAFIQEDFKEFERDYLKLYYTTMTEYDKNFSVNLVYPKDNIQKTIGDVVSSHGLKQLRIAETEKYAHVTFFLNGGVETKYEGETRILVPSPKDVKTYDLKPEMSANEVTDEVLKAIESEKYDFIVLNFANPDMVGHTGNLEACIKALEVVDSCVKKIIKAATLHDYVMLVTADHGNCECMINDDGTVNTSHTTNLVPFSVIGLDAYLKEGRLSDIAPTILEILEIEKPKEMTGESLIEK